MNITTPQRLNHQHAVESRYTRITNHRFRVRTARRAHRTAVARTAAQWVPILTAGTTHNGAREMARRVRQRASGMLRAG